MEFTRSVTLLLWGILKRIYWLLPTLALDPFDFARRLGMTYEPPQWLTWILLSVGLFIAIVLTYHELRKDSIKLKSQIENKAMRQSIRKVLGDYMSEGNLLFAQYASDKDIAKWIYKVESYLEDTLGSDYAARFRSRVGLNTQNTQSSLEFNGTRSSMEIHLIRLQEFLKELPT